MLLLLFKFMLSMNNMNNKKNEAKAKMNPAFCALRGIRSTVSHSSCINHQSLAEQL